MIDLIVLFFIAPVILLSDSYDLRRSDLEINIFSIIGSTGSIGTQTLRYTYEVNKTESYYTPERYPDDVGALLDYAAAQACSSGTSV